MPKHIEIKVLDRKNKRVLRHFRTRAPKGETYTQVGVEDALRDFAEMIDAAMPGNKYNAVQTGPGAFNFVWNEDEPGEMVAPEIAALEITATEEVAA